MRADEIRALLPWRAPFLMIDGMLECAAHRRIVTRKRVTLDDPLAADSWLPAMLLLEGMGQSAALLFRLSYGAEAAGGLPLLGHLEASLRGSAAAGQSVLFDVRAVKMTRSGGVFEARALVEDTAIAEARLAFAASRPARADRRTNGAVDV